MKCETKKNHLKKKKLKNNCERELPLLEEEESLATACISVQFPR
jgi:hypothetical protein